MPSACKPTNVLEVLVDLSWFECIAHLLHNALTIQIHFKRQGTEQLQMTYGIVDGETGFVQWTAVHLEECRRADIPLTNLGPQTSLDRCFSFLS